MEQFFTAQSERPPRARASTPNRAAPHGSIGEPPARAALGALGHVAASTPLGQTQLKYGEQAVFTALSWLEQLVSRQVTHEGAKTTLAGQFVYE